MAGYCNIIAETLRLVVPHRPFEAAHFSHGWNRPGDEAETMLIIFPSYNPSSKFSETTNIWDVVIISF